jgi:hypothetical protein
MSRNGFTSGERMIATHHDCFVAPWGGIKGKFFCDICGHKFQVGDGYRWVYASKGGLCNFFTCDMCDKGNDELIKLRQLAADSIDNRWLQDDPYSVAMMIATKATLLQKEIDILRNQPS